MLRAGVWKPRTQPDSFEGAGEQALEWLKEASELTGLPAATEVGTPQHVEAALRHGITTLWIGARTVVNPFSVQAIADALRGTDAAVMIKNPLVPSVDLWQGALERISAVVPDERIALIHRGFVTGEEGIYRFDPMWNLAVEMRRRTAGIAMLCDPSHMAGRRELVAEVVERAANMGYDGAMIESHYEPDCALSDSRQQLTPKELDELLKRIEWRTTEGGSRLFTESIESCRADIDSIDSRMYELLAERMRISERIGELKRSEGIAVLQQGRWNTMLERLPQIAQRTGLSVDFLRQILEVIHMESIARQQQEPMPKQDC